MGRKNCRVWSFRLGLPAGASAEPAGRATAAQRDNRRERLFFADADSEFHRALLREAWAREGVAVWSYWRMPNRVLLVLAPKTPEGRGRALGRGNTNPAGRNDSRDSTRSNGALALQGGWSRLYCVLGQVFESACFLLSASLKVCHDVGVFQRDCGD
jgi:hypothetical protein